MRKGSTQASVGLVVVAVATAAAAAAASGEKHLSVTRGLPSCGCAPIATGKSECSFQKLSGAQRTRYQECIP